MEKESWLEKTKMSGGKERAGEGRPDEKKRVLGIVLRKEKHPKGTV